MSMLVNLITAAQANQMEGGKDTGNLFEGAQGGQASHDYLNRLRQAEEAMRGINIGTSADEIQNNPMLSQLFGPGGLMQRTGAEEEALAKDPNQLTAEDRSAYGQASGDIARQYGEQEQSLAQALASRGMSNSGAAGAGFTGLQGNKMEQLAKVQRQIADDRLKTNMSRLSNTRQFLGQLGGQAQNAVQSNYENQMGKQKNIYDQNAGMLAKLQDQKNEQLTQQQQTQQHSRAYNQGQAANAQSGQIMGAAGSMGAMFSDSRVKKNIKRLPISLYKHVPTYSYEYISPEFGPSGPHIGVLAQDLLKSNLTSIAVNKAPNGYYKVQYEKLERA